MTDSVSTESSAFSEEAHAPAESPGALLRRWREKRQYSIAQIADRLKYGVRQIEALEANAYDRLPGTTFVRGMIRGYARLLGEDPQLVLLLFKQSEKPEFIKDDVPESRIPFPDGKRKATRAYVGVSLALVAAAMLVWYELLPWQGSTEGSTPAIPASMLASDRLNVEAIIPPSESAVPANAVSVLESAPVVPKPVLAGIATNNQSSATDGVSKQDTGIKKILLRFDRDAWVEIKQGNGKMLLSQLNPAGTQQIVEGVPPFVLIIGNAPNVHLSYDSQPIDLRPHFKVDVARLTLE